MATTTAPSADGYERLAGIYDALTAASDYEAWTTHALALATSHGWRGNDVLDVGCGTGKSFLPFLRRGFRVTGCDISPAMLAEAERKAPDVRLIEADMRALPKLGAFGLVICFDDSLNHMLDEAELAAALASLANNLAPAGLLLFDHNSLLTYRTTFAGDSVMTREGLTFVLRGDSNADAPPGCLATMHIDVYRDRGGERYERSSGSLTQRHFPPHRVTSLLGSAGLACLGVHGVLADGSHVAEADESRHLKLMYVATRERR
jgi:SAM-dependent methyltransferase